MPHSLDASARDEPENGPGDSPTLPLPHRSYARLFGIRGADPFLVAAPQAREASDSNAGLSFLAEWEELLAVYASASQVGLAILDAHLRYRVINSALAKMHDLPVEAHIGKTVRQVLGDAGALVEDCLNGVLETGQPIRDRELSLRPQHSDHLRHSVAHYVPIRNSSGQVTQVGAVVVEITEQKLMEESFRGLSANLKSEQKRNTVMADVASLLATTWDVRQAFPTISAYLRRALYQEYAELSVRDQKSGRLVRQALDFPLQRTLPPGAPVSDPGHPSETSLREGVPLILNRNEMQALGAVITKHFLAEGLQSLCCVPLLRSKDPLGVLVLGSTRASAFGHDDLALLKQVASQLSIALENERSAQEVATMKRRLEKEKLYIEADPTPSVAGIIGESLALQKVLDQVAIVAESDATVLLLGETGTGKGLVARALHEGSRRKNEPFLTLNCAAIPTGLLESELFGHEKGAFTGAIQQKVGRLEMADGGTLLLDEIGEIPIEIQPKLLRFLQDREFERLGGNRTLRVNLRLIAATNRDLAASVSRKEFRSDLFYRLNVFPIRLPALRERSGDVPLLVSYFVKKFASRMGRVIESIPLEIIEALKTYHWPGNIRELENFIERSVILTMGSALQAPLSELRSQLSRGSDFSLENSEREYIIQILRETGGLISGPSGAAQRLGVKRTTLQSKISRLEISPEDYLDGSPSEWSSL